MDRNEKEEIRKHMEARKGLTAEEIQALDAREKEHLIERLAKCRHRNRFSEEYDFISDSDVDPAERGKGINPKNDEYQASIKEKRESQGVNPLAEDGTAQSDETMQLCLKEAREEIDSVHTRIDEILFYKWDPIRLSNSNISRDEYSTYVKGVFEITLNSTSPYSLADHLTMLSTEYMGVLGNRETDIAVATLIFSIVQDYDYCPDHLVVDID